LLIFRAVCLRPYLPNLSGRAVARVHEILIKTVQDEPIPFNDEIEDIMEAAEVLGIEMKNIRVTASMGKKKKSSKHKVIPDLVELQDEPVTKEVSESFLKRFDYNLESQPRLDIEVDISSDDDDDDDEEEIIEDDIDLGNILEKKPSEDNSLLDKDSDISDDEEDESLQEETENSSRKPVLMEKINFSFLKKESVSSTPSKPEEDLDREAGSLLNDLSFNTMNELESDNNSITDATNNSEINDTDLETKLRCELCGKPQRVQVP